MGAIGRVIFETLSNVLICRGLRYSVPFSEVPLSDVTLKLDNANLHPCRFHRWLMIEWSLHKQWGVIGAYTPLCSCVCVYKIYTNFCKLPPTYVGNSFLVVFNLQKTGQQPSYWHSSASTYIWDSTRYIWEAWECLTLSVNDVRSWNRFGLATYPILEDHDTILGGVQPTNSWTAASSLGCFCLAGINVQPHNFYVDDVKTNN